MPSIKVVPETASSRIGYNAVQAAFGPGAPGQLEVISIKGNLAATEAVLSHNSAIAAVTPSQNSTDSSGYVMIGVIPTVDPSNPSLGTTIDRLRNELPSGTLVGGSAAENHDLQVALAAKSL